MQCVLTFQLGHRMLTLKLILALNCDICRELRRLSSLVTVARCTAITKKCRAHHGKAVQVLPSGLARAWPMRMLLSGLRRRVGMKVLSVHLPAP